MTSPSPQRILVTGGTGFVGRAFVSQLSASAHAVACLVRSPENLKDLKWNQILVGDLANPPWQEIERFRANVCVHCAWISTPGIYLSSPENKLHLEWSQSFLERLASTGVTHFVVLGTCIEYASESSPLSETTTLLNPLSHYAKAKNELRLWLEDFSLKNGTTFSWVRLFYPYGVGEHPQRFCSLLIQKFLRREGVAVKTPGSLKDYVHINDVGRALRTIVESRSVGPINLGSGCAVRMGDLAYEIASLCGSEQYLSLSDPPEIDPFPRVIADSSKLRALGWSPQVELKEGLKSLVAQLKSQL